jgi:two-component system response regulator YesN
MAVRADEMTSFVLIDDQFLVIEEFRSMLNWEQFGFRLVGTARNGQQGYELCKRIQPELVITDIEMPRMTGLELAEKLKREFPEMRIILLTCYDRFEYALGAIKLKADDYIVKGGADHEELLAALSRQREALIAERRRRQELEAMQISAKQLFLRDLLAGALKDESEIVKGLQFSRLHQSDAWYTVCFIRPEPIRDDEGHHAVLQHAMLALSQSLQELGERCEAAALSPGRNWAVIISHPLAMSEHDWYRELRQRLLQAMRHVKHVFGLTLTAGVSNRKRNLLAAPEMVQEAAEAAGMRYYEGTDNVYFRWNTQLREHVPAEVQDAFRRWADALNTTAERSQESLSELLRMIRRTRPLSHLLESFISEEFRKLTEQLPPGFAPKRQNPAAGFHADDLDEAARILNEWLEEYWQNKRSVALLQQKPVDWVKRWILNHLDEPLSLEELAEKCHMSPKYLGNLFRKETGESFLAFVNQARLARAQHLLLHTNEKITQIAEKIGIQDPNYFSRFFKNRVGMTPNEYRERMGFRLN